jgi:hypothetical protein
MATRRPVPVLVAALLAGVLDLAGCSAEPAAPPPPTSAPASTPPPVTNPITANPALSAALSPQPGPSGPRPANGAVITKRGTSGKGQLAIENGTDEDALVTLSRDGRAVYAVYCRASDDTELTGIADGDYAMFVAQGDGWNRELRRFTASPDYTKFDDPASFATVRETDAIRYTRLRITLQPVVGGNAGTVPVDPESYPV